MITMDVTENRNTARSTNTRIRLIHFPICYLLQAASHLFCSLFISMAFHVRTAGTSPPPVHAMSLFIISDSGPFDNPFSAGQIAGQIAFPSVYATLQTDY